MIMKLAICATDECPNNGFGYVWDDVAAQAAATADGVSFSGTIYCGPCGQAMTNQDAPDGAEAGTFIPPEPPAE